MKLFMILLLFNFGIFCYGRNLLRIWNGTETSDGKYPNVPRLITFSMASVKGIPRSSFGVCTASIISSRHILTAAHCVHYINGTTSNLHEAIIVDYDELDTNFGNKAIKGLHLRLNEHGIATIIHPYPEWKAETVHIHDIAIIEFSIDVNLTVTPMLLAKNYEEGDNDIAISIGYGDIDPDPVNATVPKALMETPVPVIKDCAWKNDKNASLVCAGTKTTRVDHGDSGGPLLINRNDALYQIGVVQYGSYINGTLADHDADFGLYTRVSAYCDWIEKTTKNEAKCVEMPPNMNQPSPAPEASPLPEPSALHGGGGMSYNIIYSLLFFISALIIAF